MNGIKPIVLITGGFGNLGSWITDHLTSSGNYKVIILTKSIKSYNNSSNNLEVIECDLTDVGQLSEKMKFITIDYVVHLASINDSFVDNYSQLALKVNSLGTRNLLEALKTKEIKKFIYFSTFHVYGKQEGLIDENTEALPVNDYAITHLFAEQYIHMFHKQTGLPYIIFRLSNSYGCPKNIDSSKWYLLFNDLCRNAVINQKIVLNTNGRGLRDFISMKDVCEVVDDFISNGIKNELFNLGMGQSFSLLEIAEFIKNAYQKYFNRPIEIIINEDDKKQYPDSLKFINHKLKNSIAFSPSIEFENEAYKIFGLLNSNN